MSLGAFLAGVVLIVLALAAFIRPRSSQGTVSVRTMLDISKNVSHEMYSDGIHHEVVIRNGVVEVCRKDGVDLESEQAKELVRTLRESHERSMARLEEDM